ncbi:amt, partial [Symbiodinium necroappetens]
KDFFSKFDESGDGSIDAEELMKGITFMSLAGNLRTSISTPPPDLKEVEQLFRLIDADGDGTLDYMELDIVMKTVQ